ncbi:MAG: bifunctional phosphoribosyl-AMP cyclohydrolase/phosphoribosyl-ATP diphosphatase HisIE [Candidatus Izemoplasmataceae bacterium]
MNLNELKFDSQGLIPVVVQDYKTLEVLMLAYMNKEAIEKTLETKLGTYYSRSRKTLWQKGETSGNIQHVKSFSYDCDEDTLLLKVDQVGPACHTGNRSCFYRDILPSNDKPFTFETLYDIIKNRKLNPLEGSYTNYLFDKGLDKILKKLGEETSEVIIGAKNQDKTEMIYEMSDLIYHLSVLMLYNDITFKDLENELKKRNE